MVMKRSLPNLNWVEGFSVRLSQLPQLQGDDDHDPMLKSFRCLLEEYGRHMARLAHTLFDVLITNLGMDPALCAPYLSESTGYLRLYRYPPYPDPDQVSGLEAHTDSSVLSILNENVVGGLQVFKDERWIDIKPVSDTLVVNMGDMMQAISNDEYKSVLHRVLALKREERFSICYFVYPPGDLMIQSTNYRPFTYNMYMDQVREDRETIGGKVGLPRFMLSEPLN
ncbi:PREDICTED: gibberellin 2-beta-dioxygenase 8-like [Nelumbo nucifera]|uniref:Gibberellin 2-beta-dioxygenase 8-like n=1 Tax=Nelumbo nucifera TaxID=4432 RepID=A0A1U8A9P1_NELNU|nr:PREDICTED: gibberellin 2-beta-dioxygenase 8-like [Nelumbo nucifera]